MSGGRLIHSRFGSDQVFTIAQTRSVLRSSPLETMDIEDVAMPIDFLLQLSLLSVKSINYVSNFSNYVKEINIPLHTSTDE